MTDVDGNRLMGWKAIGNFVGRDARTMRRWEVERGLPVYRAPGGGSASVWADKQDLRAWMASQTRPAEPIDSPRAPAPPVRPRRRVRLALLTGLIGAVAIPVVISSRAVSLVPAPHEASMPYGPNVQDNESYRAARYAMNMRSVAGLIDALQKFSALATRHPDNAAGFVGIAETNLLLREFNSLPEEVAYRRATFAAQKALALDPKSSGAMRSMAFIKYWSDGARGEGLDLFRRAIAQAPDDPQCYHWYGTALMGDGRFAEALSALDRAHALNPGSSAISADAAMVRFMKGDHRAAIDALRQITLVDPEFSGAHSYLARFYLILGDDARFLNEAAIAARLKHDAVRQQALKAAANAHRTGGRPAMLAVLIASAKRTFDQSGEGAILIAILYAASGDRTNVMAWLTRAESVRDPAIGSMRGLAELVPYRDDPGFRRFFPKA